MRLPRLSLAPKPLFLGIVALGLPFAVTVGWALAEPAAPPPPPPVAAPAGAGGIRPAPPRARAAPRTAIDYTARTSRAWSGAQGSRTGRMSVRASASATARTPLLPLPLPTLTDPPVPTPTAATSAPASPSATPSASPTPPPTGAGPGLIRR